MSANQSVVGYKLLNAGEVVATWGGAWGQCPGIPNPLSLPNGIDVWSPKVNSEYYGFLFEEWKMDEPAPSAPDEISDRQFFQQLAVAGMITQQEALDAVKTGAIPATIQSFVDTLADDKKFAAQMMLSGATVFQRNHPMTAMLGYGLGLTDEQMDAIWLSASQL